MPFNCVKLTSIDTECVSINCQVSFGCFHYLFWFILHFSCTDLFPSFRRGDKNKTNILHLGMTFPNFLYFTAATLSNKNPNPLIIFQWKNTRFKTEKKKSETHRIHAWKHALHGLNQIPPNTKTQKINHIGHFWRLCHLILPTRTWHKTYARYTRTLACRVASSRHAWRRRLHLKVTRGVYAGTRFKNPMPVHRKLTPI